MRQTRDEADADRVSAAANPTGMTRSPVLPQPLACSYVTMTSTFSRTNSAASPQMLTRPPPSDTDRQHCGPSIQPSSRQRCGNVRRPRAVIESELGPKTHLRQLWRLLPRPSKGHETVEPPSKVINSRRFTQPLRTVARRRSGVEAIILLLAIGLRAHGVSSQIHPRLIRSTSPASRSSPARSTHSRPPACRSADAYPLYPHGPRRAARGFPQPLETRLSRAATSCLLVVTFAEND